MKKILITMAVLLQVVIVSKVKAQIDPHFSQYYAYPLWLNPALTGIIDDDGRITANYKNQWATINNAYQTTAISADFRPTNKLGIGFNVLDESAGSAGYNYLTAYGSLGYAIPLSGNGYQQLHFGVQAGIISRNFDINKVQSDDQYNPNVGFDPTLPSYENFGNTGATVFDSGAGIYYADSDPSKTANIFGGFSLMHLNQPKDPFATEGINSTVPMRFTLHGGVRFESAYLVYITPHFIYMSQQKAQEKDLGIYAEIKSDDDHGIIAGAVYRFNDAAILDIGYHFTNTTIGLSYDFNTSALKAASNSQGGIELSITYVIHNHSMNREVVCPSF